MRLVKALISVFFMALARFHGLPWSRNWWYCAPDDEIEMATNVHDGTNPSVSKQ
jgi:hypothetical protein